MQIGPQLSFQCPAANPGGLRSLILIQHVVLAANIIGFAKVYSYLFHGFRPPKLPVQESIALRLARTQAPSILCTRLRSYRHALADIQMSAAPSEHFTWLAPSVEGKELFIGVASLIIFGSAS